MNVDEHGFSLLETVVATAVLVAGVVMLAQLFVVSTESNRRAESLTTASVLAQGKLTELSALVWTHDADGLPITDDATDTSVSPEDPIGGTGLTPGGRLDANVDGYHDATDLEGRLLPIGAQSDAGFARRWSIDVLPADPDTIVLQVIVERRPQGEVLARVTTVRTRYLR